MGSPLVDIRELAATVRRGIRQRESGKVGTCIPRLAGVASNRGGGMTKRRPPAIPASSGEIVNLRSDADSRSRNWDRTAMGIRQCESQYSTE